jgi:hypothetical protein
MPVTRTRRSVVAHGFEAGGSLSTERRTESPRSRRPVARQSGGYGRSRSSSYDELTRPLDPRAGQRGGQRRAGRIARFSSAAGGVLSPLVRLEAYGDWTLQVADRAARDVGKLNRWALHLKV